MTLRTVLLSLQALLAAAEPDDPQDAVVANQVGLLVPLGFIEHFYQTFFSVVQAACPHMISVCCHLLLLLISRHCTR